MGEPSKAIEHCEQVLKITQEISNRMGEGNAHFNMSLALDGLGKRAESVKLAEDALGIYEQIEIPYAYAEHTHQKQAKWLGNS